MNEKRDIVRTDDVINIEEKYLKDLARRQNQTMALLRRKRRRRIVLRSMALFVGLVLMLYGVIDIIVFKSLEATFGNILTFVVAELIAIPILIRGIVLFRTMPIDKEISAATEQLVETQDGLSRLRDERLRKSQPREQSPDATFRKPPITELLVTFEEASAAEKPGICPSCGRETRKGAKICRNCGHLFV